MGGRHAVGRTMILAWVELGVLGVLVLSITCNSHMPP